MANIINNSNINSSLCNTILGSESVVNPQVYSTKKITPPHSMSYSSMSPTTGGTVIAGNTTNFQLNKYGVISQILFSYTKELVTGGAAAAAGTQVPQNDVFKCIDKIELMSGASNVATLTRHDLLSQFSNYTRSELNPVEQSSLQVRAIGAQAANLVSTHPFCIPLIFGFNTDINTQLNSSFLENLNVKVTWGVELEDYGDGVVLPAGASSSIKDVKITCRYKNYLNEANSEQLNENFGKNASLNILSQRWYDENESNPVTATTGVLTPLKVELKSTDCVKNFYLVVLKVGEYIPVHIKRVRFSGSGQTILDLNDVELSYQRLKSNGRSVATSDSMGGAQLTNVCKIQTGNNYDETYCFSNCFSLREINSPLMEVWFEPDSDGDYTLMVCQDSAVIYEIMSATGKLSLSLVN